MRTPPPSLLWRIAVRMTAVTVLAAIVLYGWLFYTVRISANQIAEGSVLDQAEESRRRSRPTAMHPPFTCRRISAVPPRKPTARSVMP